MSLLDQFYGDTSIDAPAWEQENKSKQGSPGGLRFVSTFYLKKAPDNVGMINFLSEGMRMEIHNPIDPTIGGGRVRVPIACKKQNCELCAVDNPSKMGVYALVDWLHTYKAQSGEEVRIPTFKIFFKGINTVKIIEARRQKYKTLLGYQWEVTRLGEGFQTYYDFVREGEKVPDFSETKQVEGKEGPITVPVIARPSGWPLYNEEQNESDRVPPDLESIYSRKQMKPDYDMDWNNPQHIDLWLKLHFLNTPQETYQRLGKQRSDSRPAPAASGAVGDDDAPF